MYDRCVPEGYFFFTDQQGFDTYAGHFAVTYILFKVTSGICDGRREVLDICGVELRKGQIRVYYDGKEGYFDREMLKSLDLGV